MAFKWKKFMLKKYLIIFSILLLGLCGTAAAQGKAAGKGKPVPRRTEGVLYFVGSGNHIVECVLKTQSGFVTFNVAEKSKMTGFNPRSEDDPAWNLGARWRVVYHNEGKKIGLIADHITYLGKVESVSRAQQAAYDYLSLLADRNLRQAYARLGSEARLNLNFNAFTDMYQDISVGMRGRVICSHTDEMVKMLLAPFGSDIGELFQPAEIVRENGKWVINRLGDFQETKDGCGDF
jgi:hypothetical protein